MVSFTRTGQPEGGAKLYNCLPECLNITIQTCNLTLVAASEYCFATMDIVGKTKVSVNVLQINSISTFWDLPDLFNNVSSVR